MQAVLDALANSNHITVRVQSRSFDGDPTRTAYIVEGPSAASVQAHITHIMESVRHGAATFTSPYRKERRGYLEVWEAKGIVERVEA
jgi:hypothetical protein